MNASVTVSTPAQTVLAGTPFEKQVPGTSSSYGVAVDDSSVDNFAIAVASKVAAALGAGPAAPVYTVAGVAANMSKADILSAYAARVAANGS